MCRVVFCLLSFSEDSAMAFGHPYHGSLRVALWKSGATWQQFLTEDDCLGYLHGVLIILGHCKWGTRHRGPGIVGCPLSLCEACSGGSRILKRGVP